MGRLITSPYPGNPERDLIRVDQQRLDRTRNDIIRKADEILRINEQAEASIREARRQVAIVRDVTCLQIAYAGGWVALAGALLALGLTG